MSKSVSDPCFTARDGWSGKQFWSYKTVLVDSPCLTETTIFVAVRIGLNFRGINKPSQPSYLHVRLDKKNIDLQGQWSGRVNTLRTLNKALILMFRSHRSWTGSIDA